VIEKWANASPGAAALFHSSAGRPSFETLLRTPHFTAALPTLAEAGKKYDFRVAILAWLWQSPYMNGGAARAQAEVRH
jgi:hypothetical protein